MASQAFVTGFALATLVTCGIQQTSCPPRCDALAMTFLDSKPLRLSGQAAPWCAAVIEHHRFGSHAPAAVPTLHTTALTG